jgi:integrase
MARTAEGWKLVWRRGIASVRFRIQGKRHEVSTRERDPRKAAEAAQQIYADFVSGRVRRAASGALVHPATPLEEICADWIEAILPELGEDTDKTYETYAGHWSSFFGTIGNVTTARIGEYQRARLQSVQRTTVIKERSALLRLLTWCVEQEIIREVPEFPKLARKATGTKHKQARKKPSISLEPAEVDAILAELPEWSRSRDGKRFPLRAWFEVAYETGLRPKTLMRLLGKDVTAAGLHIRPEADKNRWERVIPLTERAQAALKRIGPLKREEPIFGKHDRRASFRGACIRALGEELGNQVTPYDLKHGRVTHLLDAGAPVNGVRFLTGTGVALDRYSHPSRRAAERAIQTAIGGHTGDAPQAGQCEGGDLNPHESYLASTSIKFDRKKRRIRFGDRRRKYAGLGKVPPGSGDGPPNAFGPGIARAAVARLALGYAARELGVLRAG